MKSKITITFSIITPVYNREDCILRCMNSVAEQNFDSFEMIVVNDGSNDHTLEKIYEVKSKFTNINIITYTDNKGVNYARNRGIEQAQGEFIIFLDSDDTLTKDSLQKVQNSINKNPGYSHYLFGVSDRIFDGSLPKDITEFKFEDWLSGKVSGDFAHVIKPSCFKNLMFIEDFRIYESLNWFRVLRKNHKQLYIPIIICDRERDRKDSVTREAFLDNKKSLQNNYDYLIQFIQWYSADFKKLNLSDKLNAQIKKAVLLGLALGENKKNKELIKNMKCSTFKKNIYTLINIKVLSPLFLKLIQVKSLYNQRKVRFL